MKTFVFALFNSAQSSYNAIRQVIEQLDVESDDISFIHKDHTTLQTVGDVPQFKKLSVESGAARGAKTGAAIGAGLGFVAVTGLLGPLGSMVAAGPLAATLGMSGLIGTTAATGLAGAFTGSIIGALHNIGLSEEKASEYEHAIQSGKILISIHTDQADEVVEILESNEGKNIEVIEDDL